MTSLIISSTAKDPQPILDTPAFATLRGRDAWVTFRLEHRDGPNKKPTKPPRSAHTGYPCDITSPKSWASYEAARQACVRNGHDGIGYVLSMQDDIAGVDLDHCRDPHTGEIASWAWELIHEFCSYTEISPTGTGVHILVRGALPEALKTRDVELYDRDRYLTVTGCHVPTTPTTIEHRQEQLQAVYQRFKQQRATPTAPTETPAQTTTPTPAPLPISNKFAKGEELTDDELLRVARRAKDGKGDRFARLFDKGDLSAANGDASSADMRLCLALAFWTGDDPERMDRLFRRSALMRDKWDERRGSSTYGERTVWRAIESRESRSEPPPPALIAPIHVLEAPTRSRFKLLHDEDMDREEAIDWRIEGVLMARSLASLCGEQESFKSFIALDMALSIAEGRAWLGRPVSQGDVVYVSAEGSQRRRRRAWYAARGIAKASGRAHFLHESVPLKNPDDVEAFLCALRADGIEAPALIVFDTLARCSAGADENSARDMGEIIAAADRIRDETGACVLLVHHVARGTGKSRGSTALPGAVDTELNVNRLPSNGEQLPSVKLNCGKQKEAEHFPTLKLRMRAVTLPEGSSLVVEQETQAYLSTEVEPPSRLKPGEARALDALREHPDVPAAEWQRLCGLPGATFDRSKQRLLELGYARKEGDGRGALYRIPDSPSSPQ